MSGCYRYRGHEHINVNVSPVTSLLHLLRCAGEREKTLEQGGGEGREGKSKEHSTRSIGSPRAGKELRRVDRCTVQAQVVQKADSAIHWINLCPLDSAISFPNTYPLDSDLSGG